MLGYHTKCKTVKQLKNTKNDTTVFGCEKIRQKPIRKFRARKRRDSGHTYKITLMSETERDNNRPDRSDTK